MILFEKVRWKNFLSTGNQYSEIDFQGSPTTLIVGANGSGRGGRARGAEGAAGQG